MTTCSGIDASTGSEIEIGWEKEVITSVQPARERPSSWIAPGWVDIQVNGFAGGGYCSPTMPHDESARSVEWFYSTGITRFYPTVITGAPEDMLGALTNLARAKQSLPEGAAM